MLQLPTVRDVMVTPPQRLRRDMDVLQAVAVLLKHRLTGVAVVDDDARLVGWLSEKDCLRLLAEGVDGHAPDGTIGDYMSRDVATLPPDMDIYYAAGVFLKSHYRRYPVLDETGRLMGIVSRADLLHALQVNLRVEEAEERLGRLPRAAAAG